MRSTITRTSAPAAVRWRALRRATLLAALALALPGTAQGSSPGGLVVVPHPAGTSGLSYFKLTASPGSTDAAGAVEVRNPASVPVLVSLSGVDGRTLSTLGSGYGAPGSARHGSARWLRLEARSVLVPARSSISLPVQVAVPAGTRPGDYLAGVSVEAQGQRASGLSTRGVSVASVDRYVIGVETSVPGPRTARIQITGAAVTSEPGGLAFMLRARNAGNVILQGVHGHVTVSLGSRTVLSRPIEPGTFVTGPGIVYPVPASGELPGEGTRYHVTAWLSYPGAVARLDTSVTFGEHAARTGTDYGRSPVPSAPGPASWWKLALLAGVLGYALFTTALLLRRRSVHAQGEPGR